LPRLVRKVEAARLVIRVKAQRFLFVERKRRDAIVRVTLVLARRVTEVGVPIGASAQQWANLFGKNFHACRRAHDEGHGS
jgi:hypothetical protein